jgi:hypothetical protein
LLETRVVIQREDHQEAELKLAQDGEFSRSHIGSSAMMLNQIAESPGPILRCFCPLSSCCSCSPCLFEIDRQELKLFLWMDGAIALFQAGDLLQILCG